MIAAIILDTETTDVESPQVIELAWKGIRDVTFDEAGVSGHQRYKPTKHITWGAMAVHHILPGDVQDCPVHSEAKLPLDVDYIIGHNVDFDWKALGSPAVKRICTLALARKVWPDLDSHTQSALIYFLCGANPTTRDALRNAHSAGADIDFCHTILLAIIKTLGITSVEALWCASEAARIPIKMPFGKHKGELIANVPSQYRGWYSRLPDADPYILEAFRRVAR